MAIPVVFAIAMADIPYTTGPLIAIFVLLLYGGIGLVVVGIGSAGRSPSWVSFAKRNGFDSIDAGGNSDGEEQATGAKGPLGGQIEFAIRDASARITDLRLHGNFSLPHIVIDSRPEPDIVALSALPADYDPSHRLPLGDGWDRFFRVYTTESARPSVARHATNLATVAASLEGAWDIEIRDSEVMFAARRAWVTGDRIEDLFTTAETLLERLQRFPSSTDPSQRIPKTTALLERLIHKPPALAVGAALLTGLLMRVFGEPILPYFIACIVVVVVGVGGVGSVQVLEWSMSGSVTR